MVNEGWWAYPDENNITKQFYKRGDFVTPILVRFMATCFNAEREKFKLILKLHKS